MQVSLKIPSLADLPALLPIVQDPRVMKLVWCGKPWDEDWLTNHLLEVEAGQTADLVRLIQLSGQVVGYIRLKHGKRRQLRIFLATKWQGKGIASVAIRQAIHLLAITGPIELVAPTARDNGRSRRMLSRLGFIEDHAGYFLFSALQWPSDPVILSSLLFRVMYHLHCLHSSGKIVTSAIPILQPVKRQSLHYQVEGRSYTIDNHGLDFTLGGERQARESRVGELSTRPLHNVVEAISLFCELPLTVGCAHSQAQLPGLERYRMQERLVWEERVRSSNLAALFILDFFAADRQCSASNTANAGSFTADRQCSSAISNTASVGSSEEETLEIHQPETSSVGGRYAILVSDVPC